MYISGYEHKKVKNWKLKMIFPFFQKASVEKKGRRGIKKGTREKGSRTKKSHWPTLRQTYRNLWHVRKYVTYYLLKFQPITDNYQYRYCLVFTSNKYYVVCFGGMRKMTFRAKNNFFVPYQTYTTDTYFCSYLHIINNFCTI